MRRLRGNEPWRRANDYWRRRQGGVSKIDLGWWRKDRHREGGTSAEDESQRSISKGFCRRTTNEDGGVWKTHRIGSKRGL